jgi:hypothetical protein
MFIAKLSLSTLSHSLAVHFELQLPRNVHQSVSDSLYDSTQLCARAKVTLRYICAVIGVMGLYHKSDM